LSVCNIKELSNIGKYLYITDEENSKKLSLHLKEKDMSKETNTLNANCRRKKIRICPLVL
jgi:hypothetical protein